MSGPFRVMHIVPALFGPEGEVGGGERYALELARHMAGSTPTRLVSFGEKDRLERLGDLEIRVLGNARRVHGQRFNPIAAGLLGELWRAEVVHCHQQHVLASSLAALSSRLLRRRAFVTDLGGGGWDLSTYVSTDRWFHGHLHISEYSRRIFGHADKPWARVIGGGVDAARFCPDGSVPKAKEALFVGRVLPHKGVHDLVAAAAEGAAVRVLGPTPDAQFWGELVRQAEGKPVQFSPVCSDAELLQAYRRASCVVLPSVYQTLSGHQTQVPELLGQTLLEGMACALPAVCTDVASLPEVVDDGRTGFVVPPNRPDALREKIAFLLSHPEQAAAMGRAARERVLEKFAWPQVVRRCLEAYASAGRPVSRWKS